MKDNIEKLKILLKRVGRESELAEVGNTLEAKQKLVNGLIEVVPLEQDEDLLIVCNEEGKLLSLPPNTLFDFVVTACNCSGLSFSKYSMLHFYISNGPV